MMIKIKNKNKHKTIHNKQKMRIKIDKVIY